MSDDQPTDEPCWEHLPDHPEAFFRLGASYDRRALKRAYTRLIKRFKPERCPAEFQRIRAAYEMLDEELRYGTLAPFAGSTAFDPATFPQHESTEPEPEAPHVDAVALLRELGPERALERLRELAQDDGLDWARLALLEDALDADPLRPHRTLIKGLSATRGSSAAYHLLSALLHEDSDPRVASTVLFEVAQATSNGALAPALFWFITDHQWTRLLPLMEFCSYRALLDRCIAEVGEDGHSGQLILLLRLRRRALLRADEEWLERVDDDLTESLRNMPSWAEDDYDRALWLSEYRDVRETFVDGSTLRGVLDGALKAIVVGDDVSADRAFLLAMAACIEHPDDLLESFNSGDTETAKAVEILQWYGDEWRGRMGVEDEKPRIVTRRSLELIRRMQHRTDRSFVGCVMNFTFTGAIFLVPLVVLGVALVWLKTLGYVAVPVSLAIAAIVVVGIRQGWIFEPVNWLTLPFEKRLYRKLWRPMTMEFLRESQVPLPALMDVLMGTFDDEDLGISVDAYTAMEDDLALSLYANAVRTLV